MFDLSGKKVVVTGGTKGIGYGIAEVFARAGAQVAVVARTAEEVTKAADALAAAGPGRTLGVRADVADPESCREMSATVLTEFGGIDVLCANAGIMPQAALATMTAAELAAVLEVNLAGTIFAVQACLDALTASGAGRVVLTSSITGPITGYPGWSHYGASKAAQLGFMRTAAIELAPRGITVNAILPGNILTEGLAAMGEQYLSGMAAAIPAGTLGRPADIGHLAAFLASAEAGYLTGQAIAVDGGQTLPESFDAVRPPH
ncbi:3-oxoacyl-ACP reductase FabG [Nocardia sp. CDC159]|uniref:3-oxoacyl-[acyl-carrier-protein] reductase MabA n=1 Tax=Nocardia pulmonis TaxID=2951408 RepID=A0A9X2ECY4_9NOCA|nr:MULTISPECIES: 3-oxoacyl-ACP reductase FabG [Nocardia]MCM6778100.1 3-oxoacyl-ACP reductase FabG [Nocardia pulmonis]MCM6790989.1 3-oxoacyl-ACP reductase FabG [Nocardia sp. CDC159]